MFVTLHSRQAKSVTGTDPAEGLKTDGALKVRPDPAPLPFRFNIREDDKRRGIYGGLFYNCAPRDQVGSIMFALPSPYREVTRADCSQFGPVLGVLVDKPEATVCEIVHAGPAPVFAGLVPAMRYYLGPMGTLVALPLTDPETTYIHYVGLAVSETTLSVQVSYPLLKRSPQ